jgi:predicted phage gp36 major capsid-like protein
LEHGGVIVTVDTDSDLAIEMWAAERVAATFREVYRCPVKVTRGSGSE